MFVQHISGSHDPMNCSNDIATQVNVWSYLLPTEYIANHRVDILILQLHTLCIHNPIAAATIQEPYYSIRIKFIFLAHVQKSKSSDSRHVEN